jgi:hypothetical protein
MLFLSDNADETGIFFDNVAGRDGTTIDQTRVKLKIRLPELHADLNRYN